MVKFIRRQAWLYALAEEPETRKHADSPEEVLLELGAQTTRILADLMGQDAGQLGEVLQMTPHHMRRGLAPRNRTDVNRTRLIQIGLLAHIGQVREHLNDVERDLWLTMQMAHDPRIAHVDPIQTRRKKNWKYSRVVPPKTGAAQRMNVCLPARLVTELDRIIGLNDSTFDPLSVPGVRELVTEEDQAQAKVRRVRRRAHGVGIQAPVRVASEMTLPLNLRIVEKTRGSIPERERILTARNARRAKGTKAAITGLKNHERAALGLKPIGRPRKSPQPSP